MTSPRSTEPDGAPDPETDAAIETARRHADLAEHRFREALERNEPAELEPRANEVVTAADDLHELAEDAAHGPPAEG
jgi:hypothetical protein